MSEIFLVPLLAALALILITSPLGCFIVWHRMAMFGDSLAHATILGVATGLIIGMPVSYSTMLVCGLFAIILVFLNRQKNIAIDSYLGVLSHSTLALGVLSLSLWDVRGVDLHALLFGDILAVTMDEVWEFFAMALVSNIVIWLIRKPMLKMMIDEGIARAEGERITLINLIFMLLVATVTAFCIKILGALLLSSFLVIPASTAGLIAKRLHQMIFLTVIVSLVALVFGFFFSYYQDAPFSPSIIVSAAVIFFLTFIVVHLPLNRIKSPKPVTDQSNRIEQATQTKK